MTLNEKYVGRKFNNLTILSAYRENGETVGECLCDCGNRIKTYINKVVRGTVRSCGCSREKHGCHGTRLYRIWSAMKARCYNPNTANYKYYGGKGIIVCNNWKNDFCNFRRWALSNGYKENLTIDRIDISKGYSPSNCRWVTMHEQNNRHKSNIYKIQYHNEVYSLRDFCDLIGESYSKLKTRIGRGKVSVSEIEKEYNHKGLSMNEYQNRAMLTCMPSCDNYSYMMLNLVGEVGELAGKVAKHIRKGNAVIENSHLITECGGNFISHEEMNDIKKEVGDCLWQLAGLCKVMGWSLEDVAQQNLDKLASRQHRGVIDGNGDNR